MLELYKDKLEELGDMVEAAFTTTMSVVDIGVEAASVAVIVTVVVPEVEPALTVAVLVPTPPDSLLVSNEILDTIAFFAILAHNTLGVLVPPTTNVVNSTVDKAVVTTVDGLGIDIVGETENLLNLKKTKIRRTYS